MMNDEALTTGYKTNYYRITLSLLLSVSPMLYAQQLSCNPSCSGVSGGFISERDKGGSFSLDNVTLTDVSPISSAFSTGNGSSIAIGSSGGSFGGIGLNATNLTIDAQSTGYHSRAIVLASQSTDTLTADIKDSTIKLNSTTSTADYNTLGILLESAGSGQIHNVKLTNTDMHISSEANNNMVGGIWVYSTNGFAEANITLDNSNINVESALGSAYGIRTENKNNPQNSVITIQDVNPGSITVKGYLSAYGISIDTVGKSAYIDNKSDINVQTTASNGQAYGIYTRAQENTINTQAQNITVKGNFLARAIDAEGAGNQIINNNATLMAESASKAMGIYGYSTAGDVTISTTGDITVRGATGDQTTSQTYGINTRADDGNVTIDVASKIDASNKNGRGIYSYVQEGNTKITLHAGSNIIGGSDAYSSAVYMKNLSGDQQLNLLQGSQISSLSDIAIENETRTSDVEINNSGQITGYVLLEGNNVVFNNQSDGVIDLKNFGQGTKDDITYDINSSSSTFNNAGLIKFADENFDGTATNAIFNVATFNNSGIIDLTGKNPNGQNDLVGDTFTLNGNYVSQGGSIYLNTLLDDASSNGGQGTSDLVVVNGNVTTGSGATNLYITPTASTANLGQLTTGDGIKVIEVQGTSSSDAFKLGRPVVAGAYEYTLGQGTDDSWYLSSYASNPNNTGGAGGIGGKIQYNPAMGAYLANQTAAVQMFQQTLFDRLISSSDGKNNDASKSLFWMKTKMTHGSYDSIHGSLSNRTRSYSLQMGGDLNVWALNNGGYFHLGVMGGYGDFKDTSKSDTTGTKTDGKVKGYSTGVYGTYFANQDTNLGLYVDLWSQMGWYRNEVSGEAQIGTKKYNSTVWSNSVEVGYGLPLAISGEYQWLATPQAQFTYNHYDVDNQRDKNNLHVSNNNASGLDTRLGVRFHARGVQKDLIEPFLEVNWLNTTAKNELDFNGKSYKDGFAKDRFEAKVGLQGNINERWSVSAQVGGQWGNNSYNNYQGQLNLNYKF